MNQECIEGVGNTKLLLEWSSRFEKFTCSLFCDSPGVPLRGLRVALAAAWPSRYHPAAFSPAKSRNSSEFSCCDAFESLFPSHDASAGVAAYLKHLATTAQLALVLEFWRDEGFALESAAARI